MTIFKPKKHSLPLGVQEFEVFTDRILAQVGAGLEQVPRDDIQFVLATSITHLGPRDSEVEDSYFVKTLRAAAAKQIAAGIFQGIKIKQQQKQLEQQAAATATTVDATNETEGQKA